MINLALFMAAGSFFNRMRGGGWFDYNKLAAWVFLALSVLVITFDPVFMAIVVLGGAIDFIPSWGWLLDLNRGNGGGWRSTLDERWKIWYVALIHRLSGGDDYKGMFLRRLFILPMFLALSYFGYITLGMAIVLALLHSVLMVVSYELGWRIGGDGIRWGEWISGAFFGVLLAVAF